MTLRELIAAAGSDLSPLLRSGGRALEGSPEADLEVELTGLAYRAQRVSPGELFFCVPGLKADGHDFAPDAVAKGAAVLVCERPLDLGVPELVVEDVRAAMAYLAAGFYGHPTEELKLVGITGTNGKTTTTFLLRQILEAAGHRTGLLGTVRSIVGGRSEEVERTTPEAVDLQRTFRRMVEAGDRACVMEVSSHALALHRADAIDYDCAVFTNLTLDHLDFHDTLDSYFEAKQRLFEGLSSPRAAVVNLDDEWGKRLATELADSDARLMTFALDREADYRAQDVSSTAAGSSFVCRCPAGSLEMTLPLPGTFNVYNALAALAAACSLGVAPREAATALAEAKRVPGRLEPVEEGQDFTVLVDYAHTPDSLANVLSASRELLSPGSAARLVCVFGAGGDRDRQKRPLMGEAARKLADHVIVTSDNPRSENPAAIIAAIVEGAERAAAGDSASSTLEVEPDRRVAIAKALALARTDDIVVIAGKGHEQGQELANGRKVPFDDREVAREELHALLGSARPAA